MRGRMGYGPPWWNEKLRDRGYRITLKRQVILEVLANSKHHLSVEDIYAQIHTKYPNLGLTTIYRTLDVLNSMGIVAKLDFGDGRARYELCDGPKAKAHHHHLICTACRQIIDYTDFIDKEVELLQETEKGLSKKYGFIITHHIIQFYGLCFKCQRGGKFHRIISEGFLWKIQNQLIF